MGEIAEMMLDGTLCECCGEYIRKGKPEGFPRYCSKKCASDRQEFIVAISESLDENDDDDENDIENIDDIEDAIDHATSWLEVAVDGLKKLKNTNKAKSLKGLIKQIEIFKNSLK